MPRFKRLTRGDLDRLTRAELLDRVEVEQQYWFRKLDRGALCEANQAGYREFQAIMRQAVNPVDALAATRELLETGHDTYWNEIPGGTR